jgi:hypothetical protein
MKKVIRLTESDLVRIVKRVINEEMESNVKGCQSLQVCKGKTFKVSSLSRLSELYSFLYDKKFNLVNYGALSTVYPPAPAPTNSPYPVGAKVAWEFKIRGGKKINISQRNECITSCPQIFVKFEGNFDSYSILDDKEYQRLKKDVEQFLYESKGY